MFWLIILTGAGLAAWRCESIFRRWAANPQAGLIAAAIPDPDQIILTDYLHKTLDDGNFEYVQADRVDGAVVRKAWQAELGDVVRRWELFVKEHPKEQFEGSQADALEGEMQKIRESIRSLDDFENRRFLRLKYRAKNQFGAMVLHDVVFTLEGKQVIGSIAMSDPFAVFGVFEMIDPRLWFVQSKISNGGPLKSRRDAIRAINKNLQAGREWSDGL